MSQYLKTFFFFLVAKFSFFTLLTLSDFGDLSLLLDRCFACLFWVEGY